MYIKETKYNKFFLEPLGGKLLINNSHICPGFFFVVVQSPNANRNSGLAFMIKQKQCENYRSMVIRDGLISDWQTVDNFFRGLFGSTVKNNRCDSKTYSYHNYCQNLEKKQTKNKKRNYLFAPSVRSSTRVMCTLP